MHETWIISVAGQSADAFKELIRTLALYESDILSQQMITQEPFLVGIIKCRVQRDMITPLSDQLDRLSSPELRVTGRHSVRPPGQMPPLRLWIETPLRVGLDWEIRIILDSHGAEILSFDQRASCPRATYPPVVEVNIEAILHKPLNESRLLGALQRLQKGLRAQVLHISHAHEPRLRH